MSGRLGTLLLGGLVVATLEALDAVVAYGIVRGVGPLQIFQGITAGVVGREAYAGGWTSALVGVVLHLAIGVVIVAIYAAVARRWPLLERRAVACGLVYGVGVYLTMAFVVIPASAHPARMPPLSLIANGVLGHAVLVGLPAAWFARRANRRALPRRAGTASASAPASLPPAGDEA